MVIDCQGQCTALDVHPQPLGLRSVFLRGRGRVGSASPGKLLCFIVESDLRPWTEGRSNSQVSVDV